MQTGTLKKSIIIIQLILIISICFIPTVYAKAVDPDKYKPSALTSTDVAKVADKGNVIIGIIQVIGSLTSVIMLIVIGIKYMVGSVEEKAEYKKSMLPYIIGAVMVFASAQLVQVIYNWAVTLN